VNRIKKLTLAGLVALAFAASAIAGAAPAQLAGDPSQWGREAKVNEYEGQHREAKVNEYEGQHREAKVNEYEGQHRVALNFAKIEIN
jgi:uncharacterized low-complexity protein